MNDVHAQIDAMNKEQLRSTCRQHGIAYGKLNNDGMRRALRGCEAMYTPAQASPFVGLMDQTAATGASKALKGKLNGTFSSDGKKVAAPVAPTPRHSRPQRTPAPELPQRERKGYKIQKEREERNGVRRPSQGTLCGAVWDYFDQHPATVAAELHTIADDHKWNRTNVACEFYSWRKFMGVGRKVK